MKTTKDQTRARQGSLSRSPDPFTDRSAASFPKTREPRFVKAADSTVSSAPVQDSRVVRLILARRLIETLSNYEDTVKAQAHVLNRPDLGSVQK